MSMMKLSAATPAIAPASQAKIGVMPTQLRRAWPLAGLVIALVANVAWIGLLVYGRSTLF
jgi:hypothetical protein